jgi:hypothetical protein
VNDLKPYLFAGLLCLGAWHLGRTSAPRPDVVPEAPGLVLRGQFIGPTAAADAAMFSALCDELAIELEEDGKRPAPWYTTGIQVEHLRSSAREGRMRGESLGIRQPHVKKLVGDYMTQKLGVNPGELTNRSEWVACFRDIARASANAAK